MPEPRLKVMLAAGLRVRGLAAAVVAAAVFLLSGCLADGLQSDGIQLESETVTAGEFGREWPLTVPSAVLYCESLDDSLSIIWVSSGDTYYPLTGFTWTYLEKHRSWMKLRDLEEIWRENPDLPGLRISVGPLMDRAFSLCGNDPPRQATPTRPPPARPAPPASPPRTQGPAAARAAPARKAAPPPVVEKLHSVGETATLIGPGGAVFTVTLHRVIDPAEIEHKPGSGNRLVAAKVELGNISSVVYSPGDLADVVSVVDVDGNEYGPIAAGRKPRLRDVSVEPGASQAGFVTFGVPEETQLGALRWSANGTRRDVAEWGIESQSKPTRQPAPMPTPSPPPAPSVDTGSSGPLDASENSWIAAGGAWTNNLANALEAISRWFLNPDNLLLANMGDADAQIELAVPLSELATSCDILERQVGLPPTVRLGTTNNRFNRACQSLESAASKITRAANNLDEGLLSAATRDIETAGSLLEEGARELRALKATAGG